MSCYYRLLCTACIRSGCTAHSERTLPTSQAASAAAVAAQPKHIFSTAQAKIQAFSSCPLQLSLRLIQCSSLRYLILTPLNALQRIEKPKCSRGVARTNDRTIFSTFALPIASSSDFCTDFFFSALLGVPFKI